MTMKLEHTIQVLCKAWRAAEKELEDEVAQFNPGSGEEGITERLFAILQKALGAASNDGLIASAFSEDLAEAHPDIQINRTQILSQGLIAEVLHNRSLEGRKTGADFGLILTSPEVERSGGQLHISQNRNGLLCQAKLKKQTWGQLTASQIKILPEHMKYLAIPLYTYDDGEYRKLCLGKWFNCKGSSVDKINKHLRTDFRRARLKSSTDILTGLALGKLGTQKSEIIDEFIAPKGNRNFELRIWWGDKDECFSETINSATELEVTVTQDQF